MKLSLVTDEISADLETAVELATDWGITALELRGYGARRVPFFSDYQKQRLRELLEESGANIVAISPGLFKIPFPASRRERFPLQVLDSDMYLRWRDARSLLEYHLQELLPASIAFARELQAEKIIMFSFGRASAPADSLPDEVLDCLHQAANEAARSKLELLIEVEDGFWADTGAHTAALLKTLNHPSMGVNWDPGNAAVAGDIPFPDGYAAVKDYVRHVHFKDIARNKDGNFRYECEGEIDWSGQLKALAADNYKGYISVEPHMRPKVASAKKLLDRLVRLTASIENDVQD